MSERPLLEVQDVSLRYDGVLAAGLPALKDVSFDLSEGECLSVIGPSGCGKSSLLALVSGIRRPTSGRILYRGSEILAPSRERVIIFQNHALYPWMTARENVEFVLRARRFGGSIREEAERVLGLVGMASHARRYPKELSGGMQQRIGIARALAADPELLLLDEPFAALDAITRTRVLEELMDLVRRLRKSMILVTHNIEEAIFVGSRVLLLSGRPGTVVDRLEIGWSRPATIGALKHDAKFLELDRRVHERLAREMTW